MKGDVLHVLVGGGSKHGTSLIQSYSGGAGGSFVALNSLTAREALLLAAGGGGGMCTEDGLDASLEERGWNGSSGATYRGAGGEGGHGGKNSIGCGGGGAFWDCFSGSNDPGGRGRSFMAIAGGRSLSTGADSTGGGRGGGRLGGFGGGGNCWGDVFAGGGGGGGYSGGGGGVRAGGGGGCFTAEAAVRVEKRICVGPTPLRNNAAHGFVEIWFEAHPEAGQTWRVSRRPLEA